MLSLCALLSPSANGLSPVLGSGRMGSGMYPIPCLDVSLLPRPSLRQNYPVCSSARRGERVSLKALMIIKRMNGHLLWAGHLKRERPKTGIPIPAGRGVGHVPEQMNDSPGGDMLIPA